MAWSTSRKRSARPSARPIFCWPRQPWWLWSRPSNTGIFLLARAPARRRELALRQALGAPAAGALSGQTGDRSRDTVLLATVLGLLASLWLGVMFRETGLFSELQARHRLAGTLPRVGVLPPLLAGLLDDPR